MQVRARIRKVRTQEGDMAHSGSAMKYTIHTKHGHIPKKQRPIATHVRNCILWCQDNKHARLALAQNHHPIEL